MEEPMDLIIRAIKGQADGSSNPYQVDLLSLVTGSFAFTFIVKCNMKDH
jgi:hypothetical protein